VEDINEFNLSYFCFFCYNDYGDIMSNFLICIFIIILLMILIGSYLLALKKENKKFLIITYTSWGLIFIALIYVTLDIIIVGGIK